MTRRHAQLATAVLLLALTSVLEAKRIYSYRDEQGVLHYSDRKPDTEAPVEEKLVEVEPKQKVFLREEGSDEDKQFRLINTYGGPIEVRLSFAQAVNIISDPILPASIVLPAQADQVILNVLPADPYQPWSYQFQYSYLPGDPKAQHDPAAVYRLPFRNGERWRIHQGFGGAYSHNEPHSYHAIDIAMDEGSDVLAARAGVVMAVEADFYGSGTDIQRWGDRANHIRVLHTDGTMAVYAHLELESVLVSVGRRVQAGDVLARSGNTGFSTGPHLHFVIQRNAGGKLVSVPFEFTIGEQKVRPMMGELLEW